jgi:HlyD family secretion protein
MSASKKTYLLILALVIIASIWMLMGREPEPIAPQYSLRQIRSGDITTQVLTTGTLSPLIMVQVGSQVSGTIQSLNADFNKPVRKGEVIAQIEPSLFKARVAQARANLKSAEAARSKAQVGLHDAQRQLDRTRRLRKQNMVSESEMDDALFKYEQAEVEHKVQLAKVAEAQATLQLAQVNLDHATIYAPIDGIVISRDVDVGQTVAASLQAPTLFTIAQDLTRMQIEAYVDEAYIGMVKENQPVSFSVYAYPERKFAGRLTQVRLNPDAEEDVVKYNCIIQVDNKDHNLKPGMTATVSIKTDEKKDILKAPNSALRYIPEMPLDILSELRKRLKVGQDQGVVWILTKDGPKPIKVNTGLSTETETEISGKDIRAGMKVIVNEKKIKKAGQRKMGLTLF